MDVFLQQMKQRQKQQRQQRQRPNVGQSQPGFFQQSSNQNNWQNQQYQNQRFQNNNQRGNMDYDNRYSGSPNYGQGQQLDRRYNNGQQSPQVPPNYDPNMYRGHASRSRGRGRGRSMQAPNPQYNPNAHQMQTNPNPQFQSYQRNQPQYSPQPNQSRVFSAQYNQNQNQYQNQYEDQGQGQARSQNTYNQSYNYSGPPQPNRGRQNEFNQFANNIEPNYQRPNYIPKSRGTFRHPSADRGRQYQPRGRGRGRGRENRVIIQDNQVMTDTKKQQRVNKFQKMGNETGKPKYQSNRRVQQQQEEPTKRKNQQRRDDRSYKGKKRVSQSQQGRSQDQIQQQIQNEQDRQQSQDLSQQADSKQIYSDGNEQQEYSEDQRSIEQQDYDNSHISDVQKYSEESSRMCSKKQFDNRMTIFLQNNNDKLDRLKAGGWKVIDKNLNLDTSKSFSIFQINKRTYLPDIDLALKKFQRSANRAEDNQQEKQGYQPRNIEGLVATMEHIKKEIIDSDSMQARQLAFPIPPSQQKLQFIQIYVFLWDRMREMIKDITRLSEQEKMEPKIIRICEQITRFFILSVNQGRKQFEHQLDYDQKLNKESLIKIMTPLLGLYSESKLKLSKLVNDMIQNSEQISIEIIRQRMEEQGIYISPNQPEITAYAILFSEDYRKYIYENLFVGFEIEDRNPLFQSKQIQQALQIKSVLNLKNYEKYFKMLDSNEFNYLISCLMSLNISAIRKDICYKTEKSFRYAEMGSVSKGIDAHQLKKLLHFTDQQTNQFKQFLAHEKIVVNNKTNYASWDDDMPDIQKLYKSPEYPLDSKLKKGVFLSQQSPEVTDRDRILKRSQIVSKSWCKSTYVQQLISAFLKLQYRPPLSVQDNSSYSANQQSGQQNVSHSIGPQQLPPPNNPLATQIKKKNQQMLTAKMQQINRRKFLQSFSNKIYEILRPDYSKIQRKTRACKKIFNVLFKVQWKFKVDSIGAYLIDERLQSEKQIYLIKLNKYIMFKKNFINQFSNLNPKLRLQQKITNNQMSSILDHSTNADKNKQQGFAYTLLTRLKQSKIPYYCIKVLTDAQKSEQCFIFIKKIVTNLGQFLFKSKQAKAFDYEYNDLVQEDTNGRRISLKMRVLDGGDKDWTHFLGADTIIFLRTKAEMASYTKSFIQFIQFQNSVKKNSYNQTPQFAMINLPYPNWNSQFVQSPIKFHLQSSQSCLTSALMLSPSLCLGLISLINVDVLNYKQKPPIQVKSISRFISEIKVNSQFILTVKSASNQTAKFILFQQYINLCFKQIINVSKGIYEKAGLYEDWLSILGQISKDYNVQNAKANMKIQYEQLSQLFAKLKLSSPFQSIQQKQILDNNDFANHYFKYCQKFDFNGILQHSKLISDASSLNLKGGAIEGDISEFYLKLLENLQLLLKQFYIIVPLDFKFSLAKQEWERQIIQTFNKIQQVKLKRLQKIRDYKLVSSQMKSIFSTPSEKNEQVEINKIKGNQTLPIQANGNQVQNNQVKNYKNKDNNIKQEKFNRKYTSSFNYCRQNWLREAKKQIKLN